REARQVDAHGARGGPLADDEVELEVLHRRVEDLLDSRVEAVDLVDEKHVARLEGGEQGRPVARAGRPPPRWHAETEARLAGRRPRCHAEADAELAGDDLRQRGLAEAGRTVQQHVVEGVAPRPGRGDEDAEVVAQLLLADEFAEALRPDRRFARVLDRRRRRDHARIAHALSSLRPARISWSSGALVPSRFDAWATAPKASARR